MKEETKKEEKSADVSDSSSSSSSDDSDSDSDSGDSTKESIPPVNADEEDQDNSKKRKADDFDNDTGKKRLATTDESKKSKIYIRGLPWRATEDEVRDYFASCGEIKSVELPLNKDGRSSGTGKSNCAFYFSMLGMQNM